MLQALFIEKIFETKHLSYTKLSVQENEEDDKFVKEEKDENKLCIS